MKYKWKQIISLLLVFCLMFGLVPANVYAAEIQPTTESEANMPPGEEDDEEVQTEEDLTLFRLYSNDGAAAIKHLCDDGNFYTSVDNPDIVKLSNLSPSTGTIEGSAHASCTKCGKESNLVIPIFGSFYFAQLKGDNATGVYNGFYHTVSLTIAEGSVSAGDGRTYEYEELVSAKRIVSDSNIKDAGLYHFGYSGGDNNGAWDQSSLFYNDGNFWMYEFDYQIIPMMVQTTFPYSIDNPFTYTDDLYDTIEKPTYKDAYGVEHECVVDFYNIDYTITSNGWEFKNVDTEKEEPVTSLSVGIYGALYSAQPEYHVNNDGSTTPVMNYYLEYNGNPYRGIFAAAYVIPVSLRNLYVNDSGDDLQYDPLYIPEMYSAITGDDATGNGAPVIGYEKLNDADLWKVTLNPNVNTTYQTSLTTSGTYPAILYARRSDHSSSEPAIFFNDGSLEVTVEKRALRGTATPYHVTLPQGYEVNADIFRGAGTVDIWADKHPSVTDSSSSKLIEKVPITWNPNLINTSRIGYQPVYGTLNLALISKEVYNPYNVQISADTAVVSQERFANTPPTPTLEDKTATTITITNFPCLVDVDSMSFTDDSEKELVRKDHTIVYGILLGTDGGSIPTTNTSAWAWQYSNVFRGLQPDTDYTFATRYEHEPFMDYAPTTISTTRTYHTEKRGASLAGTIILARADKSIAYYGDTVTLTAEPDGGAQAGVTYSYTWFKMDESGETYVRAGNTLQLRNVSDSGLYFARAIVQDADGSLTIDSNVLEVFISRNRLLDDDAFNNIVAKDITYGEPLKNATLSTVDGRALGTYSGTFAWQDPDSYPEAGDQNLPVLFTPYSIVNYAPQIISVTVHVEKANLYITLPLQEKSYGFELEDTAAYKFMPTGLLVHESTAIPLKEMQEWTITGWADPRLTGRTEDLSCIHGYVQYEITKKVASANEVDQLSDNSVALLEPDLYSYTLTLNQLPSETSAGYCFADNYTLHIANTTGDFLVNSRDVTISAVGSHTKEYSDDDPELRWTATDASDQKLFDYLGIAFESNKESNTGALFSTKREEGEEPGTYLIGLYYNDICLGTNAGTGGMDSVEVTPSNEIMKENYDVGLFFSHFNLSIPSEIRNDMVYIDWDELMKDPFVRLPTAPTSPQISFGWPHALVISRKPITPVYQGSLLTSYNGENKFAFENVSFSTKYGDLTDIVVDEIYYISPAMEQVELLDNKSEIVLPGLYRIFFDFSDSSENENRYILNSMDIEIAFVDIPVPTIDPIEYGTPLSDITLEPTPLGSFAWKNPSQVLPAGTHQVEAIFTPINNTIDYSGCQGYDPETGTITKAVSITVNKREAINKEAITVGTKKIYDGTTNAPVTGAGGLNLRAGDDVEVTVSAAYASKNVGTNIPITVSFTLTGSDASNYSVPETYTLSGEIAKAPLIIKANDLSVMFGYDVEAVLANGKVTISGLARGETDADLDGAPIFTTAYQNLDAIPSRAPEVNVSGYTSQNYDISFLPGVLMIEKLPVSAGVKSPAKVYGEEDPVLEKIYEIHGIDGQDPVAGLDELIVSELRRMIASRDDGEEYGRYEYTYAFPPSANFEFTPIPASLTIGQFISEVLWSGLDQTYKANGTDQSNKISAWYDNNGNMVELELVFYDQNNNPVRFQEPGFYTVTAIAKSDSVALTNTSKTIRMLEADPVAPDAPSTPVLLSKTDSSITLMPVDGVEFSKDNGMTWQTSNIFSGLLANTDYTFIARAKRDGLYSEPSAPATFRTAPPADTRGPIGAPVLASKTKTQIILNAVQGAEYSKDSGKTWQDSPVFSNLTPGTTYLLNQRWKQTDDWAAGAMSSTLRVTTDDAPFVPAPEVVYKSSNSIFLKLVEGLEYSIDGGKTWTEHPTFTGLLPDTTYDFVQRIKDETDGEMYLSEVLTVKTDALVEINDERGVIPAVSVFNVIETRIILDFVIGAEYSIDGGKTWQLSPQFDGLNPGTTYQCTQRWRETDKLPAGEPASILEVTTPGTATTERPALSAPMVASKTHNQVILMPIEGVEYTMDRGATWQISPVFSNLTPDTEYYFQQRYYATDDTPAGPTTSGVIIRTDIEPVNTPVDNRGAVGAPVISSRTEDSITLVRVTGVEYSIDGGKTWQANNVFTGLQPSTTYTFVQRWMATAELPAGAISASRTGTTADKAAPIIPDNPGPSENPGQPDTPTDPDVPTEPVDNRGEIPAIEIMAKGSNYLTLKPVVDAEYSIDGGKTWQDSSTFSDLQPDTMYTVSQRWKATGQLPAGIPVSISISTDQASESPTVPTTPTPDDTEPATTPKRTWANGNGFNSIVSDKNTIPRPTIHISGTAVPIVGAASTTTEENCQSLRFTDLDLSAWYHRAVDFNIANGFMVGTSATTWSPDTPLTRAQFIQILYRLAGTPSGYTLSGISDAPEGIWFYDAAAWAYAMNITGGTTATTFSPNEGLTYAQMACIVYRFCEVYGIACTTAEIPTSYDVSDVPGHATAAMQAISQTGIFNIQGATSVSPNTVVTRAQTAQIMMNICTQFNTQLTQNEILKVPTTLFTTTLNLLSNIGL